MSRLVLALAIQRASRLRADERLLLWDLVADEAAFARLSPADLSEALSRASPRGASPARPSRRRDAAGAAWDPAALLAAAESDASWLARSGARFVVRDELAYPAALRETCSPPFGLFLRGRDLPPYAPAAAVVGTRCPTGAGIASAMALARGLAAAGVPLVSGLARGIDAAAHRGSLEAGGATCAVLPCGIDRIYPPSHRSLASDILGGGGLIASEYPPGTELAKWRFPERNRIIAGLARACVVVEAPAGSGALITADHALGEGRDVWVARACLGGPRSAGLDRLAAEGAPALDGAWDLLEDWGMPVGSPAYGAGDDPGRIEARDARMIPEGRRLAASLGAELGLGKRAGAAV